jgi:hypothetical protein
MQRGRMMFRMPSGIVYMGGISSQEISCLDCVHYVVGCALMQQAQQWHLKNDA